MCGYLSLGYPCRQVVIMNIISHHDLQTSTLPQKAGTRDTLLRRILSEATARGHHNPNDRHTSLTAIPQCVLRVMGVTLFIHSFVRSFCSLSYNSSLAFFKASVAPSLSFPVPCLFFQVIRQLLTPSFLSCRHLYPSLCHSFNCFRRHFEHEFFQQQSFHVSTCSHILYLYLYPSIIGLFDISDSD